jgi:hypothetical protein
MKFVGIENDAVLTLEEGDVVHLGSCGGPNISIDGPDRRKGPSQFQLQGTPEALRQFATFVLERTNGRFGTRVILPPYDEDPNKTIFSENGTAGRRGHFEDRV